MSAKVYHTKYERTKIGAWRQYTIYSFAKAPGWVTWGDVAKPHRREKLTKEEKEAGSNAGIDFFARLGRLTRLGLVENVTYLYDGPEGEPVMELEPRLWSSAMNAAEAMLTPGQLEYVQDKGMEVFPVLSHMEQATLIGILRMRYRPQTKLTAAWFAKRETDNQALREVFDAHLEELRPTQRKQANSAGFI